MLKVHVTYRCELRNYVAVYIIDKINVHCKKFPHCQNKTLNVQIFQYNKLYNKYPLSTIIFWHKRLKYEHFYMKVSKFTPSTYVLLITEISIHELYNNLISCWLLLVHTCTTYIHIIIIHYP